MLGTAEGRSTATSASTLGCRRLRRTPLAADRRASRPFHPDAEAPGRTPRVRRGSVGGPGRRPPRPEPRPHPAHRRRRSSLTSSARSLRCGRRDLAADEPLPPTSGDARGGLGQRCAQGAGPSSSVRSTKYVVGLGGLDAPAAGARSRSRSRARRSPAPCRRPA